MQNFQPIIFIWTRTYREILKSALVYLEVIIYEVFLSSQTSLPKKKCVQQTVFIRYFIIYTEINWNSTRLIKFKAHWSRETHINRIFGGIQKVRSLKIPEFWIPPPPPFFALVHFQASPLGTLVLARTHPLTLNLYTCKIQRKEINNEC